MRTEDAAYLSNPKGGASDSRSDRGVPTLRPGSPLGSLRIPMGGPRVLTGGPSTPGDDTGDRAEDHLGKARIAHATFEIGDFRFQI
jgi:hypothetical protein